MKRSTATFFLLVSALWGFAVYAEAERFCEQSMVFASSRTAKQRTVERYHSQAGDSNPSQRFVDLANRGALSDQPKNSVQCAPTTGLNELHAAFDLLGKDTFPFTAFFQDTLAQIGRAAAKRHNIDPKNGVSLEILGPILEKVAAGYGVEIKTSLEMQVSLESLVPKDDELLIVSVNQGIRANGSPELHAMALLDAVPEANSVLLSDPAHANELFWSTTEPAINNARLPSIRMQMSGGIMVDEFTGSILRVLRIKVPSLNPAHRSSAARKAKELGLEGKYVHIRAKSGEGVYLLKKIDARGFVLTQNTIEGSQDYFETFENVLDLKEMTVSLDLAEAQKMFGAEIQIEWHFTAAREMASDFKRSKFKFLGFEKGSGPHGSLKVQSGKTSYLIPLEFVRSVRAPRL